MDYIGFLDACRSIASSVGEFASLLAAAAFSYSVVVLRSLVRRMDQTSPTKSPLGSAPVRRKRGPSARQSSSALPGASAARSVQFPPEVSEDGVPETSQVERFLHSVPPQELQRQETLVERFARTDSAHSVGRASDAERRADDGGTHDPGAGASASGVLIAVPKRE